MLFYLAATGQAHTRDFLATFFWSEASPSDAHHSLRSSLYYLRQGLRSNRVEMALISEGDLLGLQPGLYNCDVLQFRHFIELGTEPDLSRAIAVYRGPFLQGFSLPDAPGFEEWMRAEEVRLNQACYSALDLLATGAELRKEWSAAIGHLKQLVMIDPLAENIQQRLMRLYLRQGEVGPALRQYRQFENQLHQELDLAPSPETRDLLYETLRQQHSAGMFQETSSTTADLRPDVLPFTGRERLLEQLSALAQEVRGGRGATALLEGEAGIGKSRLIDELAGRLVGEAPPWIVLEGACSPFDDLLSFGPFLEALQNGAVVDPAALPTELDPSLPEARGRFTWAVLQTIRSLTHNLPLLLVIEDLQWANSSTLNLFGFLSMRLRHMPVLLIGTVQHANSIPALQRLIALGRRRGDLRAFPLTPLAADSVSVLLHADGIEPASVEALSEWLYLRSTGSPFLITEILAQLRKEAILAPAGEGWRLDMARWWRWRTAFELPETTHDLVAWRLASLSENAHHLLDILAVAGQPLPAGVLRNFPGIPADRFDLLVDDLATRRLVIEPPGAGLALPHHLLRETLLHRLSNLRQRTIHRQLAEAMESNLPWEAGPWLRQVALHSVAGEDVDRARRYGMAVLPNLPQDYAGAETVDFVHHLHDLLAPTASEDEMAQLTHALGALHQSLGHLEIAAGWLGQSLDWAQKAGEPAAQAEAYFEMSELALMANDYRRAMQAARTGLSTAELADPASGQFQMLIGRGHRLLGAAFGMEGGDLAAAEKHLQEAVTAHRHTRNQGDLCAALFELGNIAAQRGELQRALDFYDESGRVAKTGHIHYYLALACNNFAYHSLLLGQIDAAQKSAVQGLAVAEAYDLLAALLHLYSTRGEIHLYLGEWNEAEASFQRGLAIAEDLGSLERQAGYRGGLALAARGSGDGDGAIRLLEEALVLIGEEGFWHLRTRLQIWLAETLFLQGDLTRSAVPLEAALAIARKHSRTLLLIHGERLRAQLLASAGDWTAAQALFEDTLERTRDLDLPLETARLQAAWGKAAVEHSTLPEEGRARLSAACAALEACHALADLATFS